MNPGDAAGWYGKLPALGDFAQRRLDHVWVSRWDSWLAQNLQSLQQHDDWLNAYLSAPAWRFALLPGALGDSGATGLTVGVLVPSVDRVGRYFPLVVAAHGLALPSSMAVARQLWQWAGQLEDCAIAALHEDWTPERLDEGLMACALPSPISPADGFELAVNELARSAFGAHWQGHSLWFCGAEPQPRLCLSGLPSAAPFKTLFTAASELSA